jgi:hypothetical protein
MASGHGWVLVINHGANFFSLYSHLHYNPMGNSTNRGPSSVPTFSVGSSINAGQTIAHMGRSQTEVRGGVLTIVYTASLHLHFEVGRSFTANRPHITNGTQYDPLTYRYFNANEMPTPTAHEIQSAEQDFHVSIYGECIVFELFDSRKRDNAWLIYWVDFMAVCTKQEA